MSAHRECLREAGHIVETMIKGRPPQARLALELAAERLDKAALKAPPVPVDIAEEREAIVRLVAERMGRLFERLAEHDVAKKSTASERRGVAQALVYALRDAIRANEHGPILEAIRQEKADAAREG